MLEKDASGVSINPKRMCKPPDLWVPWQGVEAGSGWGFPETECLSLAFCEEERRVREVVAVVKWAWAIPCQFKLRSVTTDGGAPRQTGLKFCRQRLVSFTVLLFASEQCI